MAISAANAVSPTPAAASAAANGAAFPAANGTGLPGSPFIDSLEAVLGVHGIANGKTGDLQSALLAPGGLTKLKSKLKTDTPSSDALQMSALVAQQAAVQQQPTTSPMVAQPGQKTAQPAVSKDNLQQQAAVDALENTQSGIDIPALRAAMGRAGHAAGRAHTLPVANPLQGAANKETAPAQDSTAPAASETPATGQSGAADSAGKTDPSKTAGTKANQTKLAAALAKAAQAPVLKGNNADGAKVPNAKIGHHAHSQQKQDTATSTDQIAQMAAKIAATAGATHTSDTAPTAATAVAVAEVTAKTAATTAAPTITKVEAAAMDNAAQTALHATAPQEKTEAQALPVQFDSYSAKSDGKNPDTRSDADGKDQNSSGDARPSNVPASASQPQTFADSQQQAQTTQPAHAAAQADASTSATLAASVNGTATAQQASAQVVTNLQVAPQLQQQAPTPDQATFAALGVAIAAKSRDGEHQFDIKLDPAELGKVDVRISVDASGQAQAHLSVQHQHTLELLQNDKATLERDLRDSGLNLANNGLNFSLKGEQQPSTPTFTARNRALSISAVQSADPVSTSSSTSIAPGDSRLDIRV
ncbi:MAG TPA: flagellar hook-length control protein FliK [Rhizomicrobium sp.]|nr:flagellar hook-length control protein FliK [Rhizomicrobium sp.]